VKAAADAKALEEQKLALESERKALEEAKANLKKAKAEFKEAKLAFAKDQNATEAIKVQLAQDRAALEQANKEIEEAKANLEKQREAQRLAQAQAEAIKAARAKLHNVLSLSRVEFKYNSTDLTPKSETLLNKVAEVIKAQSNFNYSISGHTDAHGKESYNLKLSGERAEKVRAYLVGQGVDEGILTAQGFGSSQPIADNNTNEGRLQNRRVVIKIVE
ncbi:MAG TPA: hypothetical protein EYH01_04590, partial [Campylobacterales bacterium]|nr:hypothetical protein [Campylobacterales bacterium]